MSDQTKNITKPSWLAFVQSDDVASVLDDLSKKGMIDITIEKGSIETAISHLQKDNSAKFLLTDISNITNPKTKVNSLSQYCQDDTRLICVGTENDINLYRTLMHAGVDDYQILPINVASIVDSMNYLSSNQEQTVLDKKFQPMITVIGSRGGIGTSTIASSISSILSKDFFAKTCLMDLDLYSGTSALSFDLATNQGLVQALANADRLDAVFLNRLTLDVSKELSVLSSEQKFSKRAEISEDDILNLTKLVWSNYDYTVVDLNHNVSTQESHLY